MDWNWFHSRDSTSTPKARRCGQEQTNWQFSILQSCKHVHLKRALQFLQPVEGHQTETSLWLNWRRPRQTVYSHIQLAWRCTKGSIIPSWRDVKISWTRDIIEANQRLLWCLKQQRAVTLSNTILTKCRLNRGRKCRIERIVFSSWMVMCWPNQEGSQGPLIAWSSSQPAQPSRDVFNIKDQDTYWWLIITLLPRKDLLPQMTTACLNLELRGTSRSRWGSGEKLEGQEFI